MNVLDLIRIWQRRWILTTLALLVALGGCGLTAKTLPRTYQASSTIVLVPSTKAAKALGQGNPYLSFTNSISTAADIVAGELTTPAIERGLAAAGFTEPYTAVAETTLTQAAASGSVLPGPFIVITVTGGDPESVQRTLSGVTAQAGKTMLAMQADMPRGSRIAVSVLSRAPHAKLSVSAVARSLVLIVGLLLIVALTIPVLVDAGYARRRGRRRTTSPRIPAQPGARERPQEVGGRTVS
jgi:capsular polysaccharide biosynthesis protein